MGGQFSRLSKNTSSSGAHDASSSKKQNDDKLVNEEIVALISSINQSISHVMPTVDKEYQKEFRTDYDIDSLHQRLLSTAILNELGKDKLSLLLSANFDEEAYFIRHIVPHIVPRKVSSELNSVEMEYESFDRDYNRVLLECLQRIVQNEFLREENKESAERQRRESNLLSKLKLITSLRQGSEFPIVLLSIQQQIMRVSLMLLRSHPDTRSREIEIQRKTDEIILKVIGQYLEEKLQPEFSIDEVRLFEKTMEFVNENAALKRYFEIRPVDPQAGPSAFADQTVQVRQTGLDQKRKDLVEFARHFEVDLYSPDLDKKLKELRKAHHPDRGGNHDEFLKANKLFNLAEELGYLDQGAAANSPSGPRRP